MHYKDGTEAKVGDLVTGTTYNVKGPIVGTLLGMTPGSTSCNARVAVIVTRELGDLVLPLGNAATPHVQGITTHDGHMVVHREYDGTMHMTLVGHKVDYTAVSDLTLVARP